MKKMDEYVQQVATEMWSQLRMTLGVNIMWSWGIRKVVATICNEMPALQLHVNGRLFKGYVLVALNEGSDTYQLFVKKTMRGELTCICDECYCDNFGQIIDRYIESGDGPEEYEKFCEQELMHLICQ